MATYLHVTDRDFDKFKATSSRSLGAHFGEREHVESVARLLFDGGAAKVRVLTCDLLVKNPLRLQDYYTWEPHVVRRQLMNLGILPQHGDFMAFQEQTPFNFFAPSGIKAFLKTRGYDSVVYLNRYERPVASEKLEQWAVSYTLDNKRAGQFATDAAWKAKFPGLKDSIMAFDAKQVRIKSEVSAASLKEFLVVLDSKKQS